MMYSMLNHFSSKPFEFSKKLKEIISTTIKFFIKSHSGPSPTDKLLYFSIAGWLLIVYFLRIRCSVDISLLHL